MDGSSPKGGYNCLIIYIYIKKKQLGAKDLAEEMTSQDFVGSRIQYLYLYKTVLHLHPLSNDTKSYARTGVSVIKIETSRQD